MTTKRPPKNRNSPAWERYWVARGFFNFDFENVNVACYPDHAYGTCYDRGCVAHGCWVAHDEGWDEPTTFCDVRWADAPDFPDDLATLVERTQQALRDLEAAIRDTKEHQ